MGGRYLCHQKISDHLSDGDAPLSRRTVDAYHHRVGAAHIAGHAVTYRPAAVPAGSGLLGAVVHFMTGVQSCEVELELDLRRTLIFSTKLGHFGLDLENLPRPAEVPIRP